MKRYRFRLEPVLRVRRIEEERARGLLLDAQRAVADQERVVAEWEALYARLGTVPSTDAASFTRAQLHRSGVAQQVLAERRTLDGARDAVRAELAAWSAAAARVSALERLDERRREEHGLAERREQDALADELVTARHGRESR